MLPERQAGHDDAVKIGIGADGIVVKERQPPHLCGARHLGGLAPRAVAPTPVRVELLVGVLRITDEERRALTGAWPP